MRIFKQPRFFFVFFMMIFVVLEIKSVRAAPSCEDIELKLMQKFLGLDLQDARLVADQILKLSESQPQTQENILKKIEELPSIEAYSTWKAIKEFVSLNFIKPEFRYNIDATTSTYYKAWVYTLYSIKRIAIFAVQLLGVTDKIFTTSPGSTVQKRLKSEELKDVLLVLLNQTPQALFEKTLSSNQSISLAEKRAVTVILNHNWWLAARVVERKRTYLDVLKKFPSVLQRLYANRSQTYLIEPNRKTLEDHLKDRFQNMQETILMMERQIGTEFPEIFSQNTWKLDEVEFIRLANVAMKNYADIHNRSNNTFDKLRIRNKQNELLIFLNYLQYVKENPSSIEQIRKILESNEPISIWYRGLFYSKNSMDVLTTKTTDFARRFSKSYLAFIIVPMLIAPNVPVLNELMFYKVKPLEIVENPAYLKELEGIAPLINSETEKLKQEYNDAVFNNRSDEFLKSLRQSNPEDYQTLKKIIESELPNP